MLDHDEFLWAEKYRPKTVEDCILPERLKKVFLECVKSKTVPNMLLFGSAGVGKTTAAIAMCEEIDLNYMLINASNERGIDVIRNKVENYASTVSLTGGQKVIIFDEADYLTPEAQAILRGSMQTFSSNCAFIFTCNFQSKLIEAIHSRCAAIDFKIDKTEKNEILGQFFKRCGAILKENDVSFDKQVLAKFILKYYPDFRRTLNELQHNAKRGAIDVATLGEINELRNIEELYAFLRDKDFSAMRKWVVENGDVDPTRVFRRVYDTLKTYLEPESVPQAVLIIARYQYQAAFVADQEVNLVAMLTELMVDCSYAAF